MATNTVAMAAALAVRDACKYQVEKSRAIDNLNIDAIVERVVRVMSTANDADKALMAGIAHTIQTQSGCAFTEALEEATRLTDRSRPFGYSRWRHGGWYVSGVRYPSGACGCVSNNYPDKKWRIACDGRRQALNEPGDWTYRSREEAARAEQTLALDAWKKAIL